MWYSKTLYILTHIEGQGGIGFRVVDCLAKVLNPKRL